MIYISEPTVVLENLNREGKRLFSNWSAEYLAQFLGGQKLGRCKSAVPSSSPQRGICTLRVSPLQKDGPHDRVDTCTTLFGQPGAPTDGIGHQALEWKGWSPSLVLALRAAQAQVAAEAAEAAGAQNRFWEMHHVLFENQDRLAPKDLNRYAEQIGLDVERFRDELKAKEPSE